MAVAAVDGFGVKFGFGPDLSRMVGGLVVTANAGVELAAAFVPDGNNVALGVVVNTLSALIHTGAVDGDG